MERGDRVVPQNNQLFVCVQIRKLAKSLTKSHINYDLIKFNNKVCFPSQIWSFFFYNLIVVFRLHAP